MNEAIFIATFIVDFGFVLVMSALGKEWVYASAVVNLILIGTFGAKLISVFGFVTNSGNLFYAAIFFAAYLLIEHDGEKVRQKVVWLGVTCSAFFMVMAQLSVSSIGAVGSDAANDALRTIFSTAPRIAFASLSAYMIAQYLNIWMFSRLRERSRGKSLWIRGIATPLVSQAVDSVFFFSIAFLDVIPFAILLQAALVGYVVKAAAGVASVPFLYVSRWMKKVT